MRIRRKKEKVFHVADHLVEPIMFDAERPEVAHFALEAHDTGALRADLLMQECLKLYNDALPEGEPALTTVSITRIAQREKA